MFKQLERIGLGMVLLLASIAAPAAQPALDVVPEIDLARYAGQWHEVARLPNRFQSQCVGDVTASYQLGSDGRLAVINACRLADGSLDKAEGVARLASTEGPGSKLEVRFAPAWLGWLPLVWGDYWVIELAPDYSYSVVGTPSRKYFWILARSPQMDEASYSAILARAAAKGFDTSRVQRTDHGR